MLKLSNTLFNCYHKIIKNTNKTMDNDNDKILSKEALNETNTTIAETIFFILGILGLIIFYISIFFTSSWREWRIWTLFIPLLIWLLIKEEKGDQENSVLFSIFFGILGGGIFYLMLKYIVQ